MLANRSMPASTIIPELAYEDVPQAVAWLCDAFGLEERLRIGDHRAQLSLGRGAVIVVRLPSGRSARAPGARTHAVMARVADLDRRHAHAVRRGVQILRPPEDYPYGERQFTAEDIGGHVWTFSQTTADVDPADWGGTLRFPSPAHEV